MAVFFRSLLIFIITIIPIGCGNSQPQSHVDKDASTPTTGHGIVAGDVIPKLTVEQKGQDIVLHFKIKNQTEHIATFTFPTSQRFDYIITSNDGNVVTQYSKGRMFSQIVSTIRLKQGEHLSFDPVVHGLSKGSYLVTIWLTAKENSFKTSSSFSID